MEEMGENQSAMWANSEMEHHIDLSQERALFITSLFTVVIFLGGFNDTAVRPKLSVCLIIVLKIRAEINLSGQVPSLRCENISSAFL